MTAHTVVRRKELESIMRNPNTNANWADIDIRLANSEDAPVIEAVLSQSFEEYKTHYTDGAFQAAVPPLNVILRRMEEGPVWVAEENGEVVGTISVRRKGNTLLLRGLAVLPAERGRAVGKQLLIHVARYAFENGCRRMALTASPFLARALREVEQFGFERSPTGPESVHGTPVYSLTKRI